jgi:hypothetical protein
MTRRRPADDRSMHPATTRQHQGGQWLRTPEEDPVATGATPPARNRPYRCPGDITPVDSPGGSGRGMTACDRTAMGVLPRIGSMNHRHQTLPAVAPTLGTARSSAPATARRAGRAGPVNGVVAAETGGTGGAGQPPSPPPVPPSTTDTRGGRPSVMPETFAHLAMPDHAQPDDTETATTTTRVRSERTLWPPRGGYAQPGRHTNLRGPRQSGFQAMHVAACTVEAAVVGVQDPDDGRLVERRVGAAVRVRRVRELPLQRAEVHSASPVVWLEAGRRDRLTPQALGLGPSRPMDVARGALR